jgi:flagellar protein FlaF
VVGVGFSVSGSAAIVFVGAFLAFSTLYTASANGFERTSDASHAVNEEALERQNTAIEVVNVTYDNGTLTVAATNNGSVELSVPAVDLLVDNVYQDTFESRTVEGDASTDLWLPGERLRLEVSVASRPARIKLVTGPGVADTEVI